MIVLRLFPLVIHDTLYMYCDPECHGTYFYGRDGSKRGGKTYSNEK